MRLFVLLFVISLNVLCNGFYVRPVRSTLPTHRMVAADKESKSLDDLISITNEYEAEATEMINSASDSKEVETFRVL